MDANRQAIEASRVDFCQTKPWHLPLSKYSYFVFWETHDWRKYLKREPAATSLLHAVLD